MVIETKWNKIRYYSLNVRPKDNIDLSTNYIFQNKSKDTNITMNYFYRKLII